MIWKKLNKFTDITKFKSLSEAARTGKLSQDSMTLNPLNKNKYIQLKKLYRLISTFKKLYVF